MNEWNLVEAAEFIRYNTLDNEDFLEADDIRKTALLNVALRTIKRRFAGYTIPNEASYIFAATLAALFNDTNKLAQQGVASFSVGGKVTYTFKDWAKKDFSDMIPEEVAELIGAKSGRCVSYTIL